MKKKIIITPLYPYNLFLMFLPIYFKNSMLLVQRLNHIITYGYLRVLNIITFMT